MEMKKMNINNIKVKTSNLFRTLWAQIKSELIIQIAYPVDFFGMVFTALFIGMWIISFALAVSKSDTNSGQFSSVAIFGLIIFFFYNSSLWSIGNFVRRRQLQGTLESIWLSPSNKIWVTIGSAIGGYIIMLVANILIVLGFMVLVPVHFGSVPLGLLILVIAFVQSIGFGFIIGALFVKVKQVNALNNLIQFSTLIISAVFFPFSVFPSWLLWISRLHPFSWVVDSFRVAMGAIKSPELLPQNFMLFGVISPFYTEIIILILISVILLIAGILTFKAAIKKAIKEGTLSQY